MPKAQKTVYAFPQAIRPPWWKRAFGYLQPTRPSAPRKLRPWARSESPSQTPAASPAAPRDALAPRALDLFGRLARDRFRRSVARVLALGPRGFVRHDVLKLSKLSAQLQVEWRTRDIHPWDRSLSAERRAELFREQAAHDTDAAIQRFFATLPEMDAIDIRVLAPQDPSRPVLAGRVTRHDALAARSLSSPRLRLRMMGVRGVK